MFWLILYTLPAIFRFIFPDKCHHPFFIKIRCQGNILFRIGCSHTIHHERSLPYHPCMHSTTLIRTQKFIHREAISSSTSVRIKFRTGSGSHQQRFTGYCRSFCQIGKYPAISLIKMVPTSNKMGTDISPHWHEI